jgi:hypothetical protein
VSQPLAYRCQGTRAGTACSHRAKHWTSAGPRCGHCRPRRMPTIKDVLCSVLGFLDTLPRLDVEQVDVKASGPAGFHLTIVVADERNDGRHYGRSTTVVPFDSIDSVVKATVLGALADTRREDE